MPSALGRHRRYEVVLSDHGQWMTLEVEAFSEALAHAAARMEFPGATVIRIRPLVPPSILQEVTS
jgi:hypothetical protein